MAPRPKAPPPDRRQEILDAALQVFARKGYAAATNREIAAEAGVTAAAIYWYFPSKEDLFRAVLADRQVQILPHVEVLRTHPDAPPREAIRQVFMGFLGFITQERNLALVRLMFAEGPRNPEVVAALQTQLMTPVLSAILPYMQHQVDRGVFRPIDPRVLHPVVAGPLFVFLLMRYLFQFPHLQDVSPEQMVDKMVDTLMDGLLARPAGADPAHPEE